MDRRRPTDFFAWTLFVVWAWLLSRNFSPAYFYEGDEASIVMQVLKSLQGLDTLSNGYRYPSIPFLYELLSLLSIHLVFTPIQIFQGLSFLGILSAVYFMLRFLNQRFQLNLLLLTISVGLVIEITASALYANDTAIALGIAAPAFYLRLGKSATVRWLSRSLLLLSLGFRFDMILLFPIYVFIFGGAPAQNRSDLRNHKFWSPRLKETSLLLVGVAVFFLLAQVNPLAVWKTYQNHLAFMENYSGPGGSFVKSLIAILPYPLAILLVLGVIEIYKRREWLMLTFLAVGTLPGFMIYLPTLTTPKYLLPAMFICLLPMAKGFEAFRGSVWRRMMGLLFVVACFTHYLGAFRDGRFHLFHWGPWLATHDGPRLSSGLVMLPRLILQERRNYAVHGERQWASVVFEVLAADTKTTCIHMKANFVEEQILKIKLTERGYFAKKNSSLWTSIPVKGFKDSIQVYERKDAAKEDCFIWKSLEAAF